MLSSLENTGDRRFVDTFVLCKCKAKQLNINIYVSADIFSWFLLLQIPVSAKLLLHYI